MLQNIYGENVQNNGLANLRTY